MPDKETLRRARADKAAGKSASTQAGEFVREEIHHIREGKHGARSTEQAIAIGLSKARRAGVKLGTPKPGSVSEKTRHQIAKDTERAKHPGKKPNPGRSRGMLKKLKQYGSRAASHQALSRHAKTAARRRARST